MKSRGQGGRAPSEGSGEESFLASARFCGCQPSLTLLAFLAVSLQSLLLSYLTISLHVSSLCLHDSRTLVIGFGGPP